MYIKKRSPLFQHDPSVVFRIIAVQSVDDNVIEFREKRIIEVVTEECVVSGFAEHGLRSPGDP